MNALKAAYLNEIYKLSKKKKLIVAGILSFLLLAAISAIALLLGNFAGINVMGQSGFSFTVLSVMNYTLIPLFSAFICIDMFGGEYSDQTMKTVLTRPVARFKVYGAKACAAATFIICNLLFMLILSSVASLFISGGIPELGRVIIAYLVSFVPLMVFALLVIMISNLVKGSTGAFFLCVLIYLLLCGLNFAFPAYKSLLFTSMLNWYSLFIGSYINIQKILRVFLILSGCGAMFFGIGYYLFEKKEL